MKSRTVVNELRKQLKLKKEIANDTFLIHTNNDDIFVITNVFLQQSHPDIQPELHLVANKHGKTPKQLTHNGILYAMNEYLPQDFDDNDFVSLIVDIEGKSYSASHIELTEDGLYINVNQNTKTSESKKDTTLSAKELFELLNEDVTNLTKAGLDRLSDMFIVEIPTNEKFIVTNMTILTDNELIMSAEKLTAMSNTPYTNMDVFENLRNAIPHMNKNTTICVTTTNDSKIYKNVQLTAKGIKCTDNAATNNTSKRLYPMSMFMPDNKTDMLTLDIFMDYVNTFKDDKIAVNYMVTYLRKKYDLPNYVFTIIKLPCGSNAIVFFDMTPDGTHYPVKFDKESNLPYIELKK